MLSAKRKIPRFLENGKALNATANLLFHGERLVSKYAIFGGQDAHSLVRLLQAVFALRSYWVLFAFGVGEFWRHLSDTHTFSRKEAFRKRCNEYVWVILNPNHYIEHQGKENDSKHRRKRELQLRVSFMSHFFVKMAELEKFSPDFSNLDLWARSGITMIYSSFFLALFALAMFFVCLFFVLPKHLCIICRFQLL